jgi:hypothetical protein
VTTMDDGTRPLTTCLYRVVRWRGRCGNGMRPPRSPCGLPGTSTVGPVRAGVVTLERMPVCDRHREDAQRLVDEGGDLLGDG